MSRDRRGFALLATLWVLVALTTVTGVGIGVARLGTFTTRNRILLARADWAREACGEVLLARYADDAGVRAVPPLDLGRGTWCRATVADPGAALPVNVADSAVLARLLLGTARSPAAVAWLRAILTQREVQAFADTGEVRRLSDDVALVDRLLPLLTTRGTGPVNVNAAPPAVLRVLPGFSEEAVQIVIAHRARRPLQSLDEILGLVSAPARAALLAAYPDLVRTTTCVATQLIARLEGGVTGTPIVSRATLTLVPLPDRLAVIRREVE